MRFPSSDVLVIGAGAAGLAAASELAGAGASVLVVEARDRIGGRVWSHREPDLPVPVELGAEFIHGRPAVTFSLLKSAGLGAVDAPFVRYTLHRRELKPDNGDSLAEVRRILHARAGALANRDVSFRNFLERCGDDLSEGARSFAMMRVKGYDAADPARVSARTIAEEWSREALEESGHFRPQGGYGVLMDYLSRRVADEGGKLRLKSVVHRLQWKHGSVTVEGASAGRPFRAAASRAIVTLPLGVLKMSPGSPGAVRFMPRLAEKDAALDRLASGYVVKVALRFHRAFWDELDAARYRHATFFRAPRAVFPTFWTALPSRAPLLIAWVGGPGTSRVPAGKAADITECAMKSLKTIFGPRAGADKQFKAAYCHDWRSDPFARGAYSYTLVGGERARKLLAAPLDDTLFFAGEATDHQGEHATVAGALQSGIRAARQLLAATAARGM